MYLIWTLINTAFVILFFGLVLTLFSKGKQLFNNKYGNAIILVFVLGVIGMLNAKELSDTNTYVFKAAKHLKGHNVAMRHAKLEETIPFTLHFNVSFKKNEAGELIPSSSYSGLSGFINGYHWEVTYVDVDPQTDGTHAYEINGVLHWYLFGIKIYSEGETFSGTLDFNAV